MTEMLTIPLRNLLRETHSALSLGDSRIVAWNDLPSETQEVIGEVTDSKYIFILQMPSRVGEEPRRTLDRALTVFKLFKDSLVLSNYVFMGTQRYDVLPHYTHWIDRDRGFPEYRFFRNEEPAFVEFWNEFIELPPQNFAAYRFHLADYRAYSRDRLTDYVESLEYLLVPDSGEGEIGYKFRSRGCMIFGKDKNAKERENIWNCLKQSYDLRSAIVHGDSDRENELVPDGRWEDRLQLIRQYDRDAIKFFFRARCLDNNAKRLELLKKKLIFEAKIT